MAWGKHRLLFFLKALYADSCDFFHFATFSSLIDGFETGLNDPFQQLPEGNLNWVRETCLQETNIVSCMQHVGGNKWVTRLTYYSARNGKVKHCKDRLFHLLH